VPFLPPPPSGLTGVVREYLDQMCRVINQLPNVSYFSSSTSPNSNLTGIPGDLAINANSATTHPRVWVMGGQSTSGVTVGWLPVTVGEP
jgi:hypothetical protein